MKIWRSTTYYHLYTYHILGAVPKLTCVKYLLLLFHDGVLYLGKYIHVTIKLIAAIVGLPSTGMNPTPLLEKDQEASLAKRMKENFGIQRRKRVLVINIINEPTVIFDMKVLTSNLLCKLCLDKCSAGEIAPGDVCVEGVQLNWC